MTLIIGILCSDGIVLGADSAATYATNFGQSYTIKQQTSRKLQVIGQNIILGVSGPVGLGQSYREELETYIAGYDNVSPWSDVLGARKQLHTSLWKHAEPLWKNAETVSKTVGAQAAMQDVNHNTLIAFPVKGIPHLIGFSPQCAAEAATESLPFVSIGSGQTAADPFLAFIRRVFWPKSLPTTADAILSAVWALEYSIHAQPSGIAKPIQIAVLQNDPALEIELANSMQAKNSPKLKAPRENMSWKATHLSEDALQPHFEMIQNMERDLQKAAKSTFESAPSTPIPT